MNATDKIRDIHLSHKPFTPGAPITWTQYSPTTDPVHRTGIILSGAPVVEGTRRTYWVLPDAPAPTDGSWAIAVGVASRAQDSSGNRFAAGDKIIAKGTVFASNHYAHPLTKATKEAASRMSAHRSANQARATA